MATVPMPMTDQEMPTANDLGDRTPREDNEEIQAQETDSALRDTHEERQTPEIPAQGMDNALQADNEEMQPQETNNALLDAMLNDCRVEMVPLDAIYVEGEPQDDDLVKALAHSIGLIGLQNPICIVENDIPEHAAPYRLVSGNKRLAAFLKLKRTTILSHILSFVETDSDKYVRKDLATTEDNFVRKHYSFIELCELVWKSKEI